VIAASCRLSLDSKTESLIGAYLTAKEAVIASGYADEIDWQHNLSIEAMAESDFLREGAWVILSCGMRGSVVRSKFPGVSRAFEDWASAAKIVNNRATCRRQAMKVFGHEGKIDAIIELAERVASVGFEVVRDRIQSQGLSYLQTFSYIGPVTAFHLAKNLGYDVVKPDRHLVRISHAFGYESPTALCRAIADFVGDKISVIDLVLWRFATIQKVKRGEKGTFYFFRGISGDTQTARVNGIPVPQF